MNSLWILNHYATIPSESGGTRHFDLAVKMYEKGILVKIFASSFNHFSKKELFDYNDSIYIKKSYDNIDFCWIKTPAYSSSVQRIKNILVFSKRLEKVLNQELINGKPDYIIGSSVHPLTALVGLKFAQKHNIKFIFEERDLWPQTFIDFGKIKENSVLAKILFKIESKLYKQSYKTIFLFEKAIDYATTKGLNAEKGIYIPNGFNSNRLSIELVNEKYTDLLNVLKSKKICLYIGSMGIANDMEKIIDLAIECSKSNKSELHFLLIGDGPKKQELVSKVKNENLSNVTFLNPIPKNDIPIFLKYAYCGLISIKNSPLYKWGMSMNKLYDYLSVGLPILVHTDLDSLGYIEKSNAIYKSNSSKELCSNIGNLENIDREYIQRFAFENYSWDILAERLINNL